MRRLLLCVALAVASARPLDAQTVLYSSAASQNRIDIYSIRADGSPSPGRIGERFLGSIRPRRMIARGCRLYVAEQDRVEVFRIKSGGGLDLIGATRRRPDLRSHDIELFPDQGNPTTLIVPLRKKGAIAAYPLDAEGTPSYRPEQQGTVLAGLPSSCVYGPSGADWEDIEVEGNKLYATFTSRVDVYGITDTARCSSDLATTCTTDADCSRCELAPSDGMRHCSNDFAIICQSDQDCVGTCSEDLADKPRCSNDPGKICVADTDCAPICTVGLLTSAARVAGDFDKDKTIEVGETVCPPYSTTEADAAFGCIDPDLEPKPKRPSASCTFSSRGNIAGGVGLAVDGQTLLVGTRFTHRVQGFVLEPTTGNFPVVTTDPADPDTKKKRKTERKCRKRNRTGQNIRYIGLTLDRPANADPIVYAAGFVGRTDAFRLSPEEPKDTKCDAYAPAGALTLPVNITSSTFKDVVSTPTRTTIGATAGGRPVLYVAAGERDRIQAFRLFAEGGIDPDQSPMQTTPIDGSFPNDVVLVDIASCD